MSVLETRDQELASLCELIDKAASRVAVCREGFGIFCRAVVGVVDHDAVLGRLLEPYPRHMDDIARGTASPASVKEYADLLGHIWAVRVPS